MSGNKKDEYMHEEINKIHSDVHETDIKEDDYLLTYDTGMIFEQDGSKKMKELILGYVSTSGSAICCGKYSGHGFNLRNYLFKEECEWIIKKHINWNNNLSHIAIPVKKSSIQHIDDEEKIAYRDILRKIIRVENLDVETMKEHIQRVLDQYKP
jgi:hypothetical protein